MWSLIMLLVNLCDQFGKGHFLKLDRYEVDPDIVIIKIMWLVSLGPKVITLIGYYCSLKSNFAPFGIPHNHQVCGARIWTPQPLRCLNHLTFALTTRA
jgi:hypothetical protein